MTYSDRLERLLKSLEVRYITDDEILSLRYVINSEINAHFKVALETQKAIDLKLRDERLLAASKDFSDRLMKLLKSKE